MFAVEGCRGQEIRCSMEVGLLSNSEFKMSRVDVFTTMGVSDQAPMQRKIQGLSSPLVPAHVTHRDARRNSGCNARIIPSLFGQGPTTGTCN
jgi:hypothetical protein